MGVSLGMKKERKEAEQRGEVLMFYCFILHLVGQVFQTSITRRY